MLKKKRQNLTGLKHQLQNCQGSQRFSFSKQIRQLKSRSSDTASFEQQFARLQASINASITKRSKRVQHLPRPNYPETLPVARRRHEIIKAISENQVTILCGETGSGKTTQLPKMCLEMGRGVDGLIGHTQPRRLAARSVAARIAEELESELGTIVGYKVRFHDRTREDSYIKLMTDGILLAEIRNDRYLNQYDTLIIDEAHERSLNIDFLLGYLRWLLPRRKDLKVIITSATIDPLRFARHFSFNGKDAPVIEVSGRTYPVQIRYRSLIPDIKHLSDTANENDADEKKEKDMLQAIVDASDELMLEAPGGILVFLPGEREIREAGEALRKHHKPSVEILPLFARLSAAEQNRIFHAPNTAQGIRRIVLATNVAETSLTVPGIKYVIDTGLARISRYSWRSRIQRLPIEKISQASANQRSGRCGRTSHGIAIRLYSEDDFESRVKFTLPEIQRTNLASVILQLASLNLGDVDRFPYVEAPDSGMVRDGYKLLYELGAVNKPSGDKIRITKLGRQLAGLPIDPRLGRMLLAANELGVLNEVLVIASALSVQDVRERPLEKQQASDQKHGRFKDEGSDFISLLNLWDYYHDRNGEQSQGQLRKLCRREFLSFARLREWNEIYRQLRLSLKDTNLTKRMGSVKKNIKAAAHKADSVGSKKPLIKPEGRAAKYQGLYHAIHQSLLTGLLSNIGVKDDNQDYLGANNRKFTIFPGSGLRKKSPKWIMCAELVETSRLFARTVARIQPQWVEVAAKHLLKYHYSEPRWEKRAAQVAADERSTLYGITINPGRRVNFGPIDRVVSRQLFIRHALVYGEYQCKAKFFKHNRALIEEVENLEAKSRRKDILVDEEILYDFYDGVIPEGIYSGPAFETWRKTFEKNTPQALFLSRDYLMQRDDSHVQGDQYPEYLKVADMRLPLSYHFEPGADDDGVTIKVPVAALNQLNPSDFDYLVPGMLEEKITDFIRGLPKRVRKQFVPAPEYARACLESIRTETGRHHKPIVELIAQSLKRMTGYEIESDLLRNHQFSEHMQMRFDLVDEAGKTIKTGRNLENLKQSLKQTLNRQVSSIFEKHAKQGNNRDQNQKSKYIERSGITQWDFETLPESLVIDVSGMKIKAWPALVDEGDSVAIKLFDNPRQARRQTGLLRLCLVMLKDEQRALSGSIPALHKLCLYYASTGKCDELKQSIVRNSFRLVFFSDEWSACVQGAGIEKARFYSHIENRRTDLQNTLKELSQQLMTVLSLNHEIRKQLKGNIDLSLLEALNDMKDQLQMLVYPGFLDSVSLHELRQYPRYLKAILKRLDKLSGDAHKDRALRLQVQPLWDAYKKQRIKKGNSPELHEFRWMLEEFRVSLFAQELGTAYPVSAKRLLKKMKGVIS